MTVVVMVNGEQMELPERTTVATMAGQLVDSVRGIAVALNETVLPRSEWSSTELGPDDRVEVLRAAQGGC